jgi:probable HAF family extracellular repeat protein
MTRINSRAFHAALAVTTLATCPYLWAQTRYQVSTLPGLGGTASQANSINQRSWVSGAANLEGDTISKAALWIGDSLISLGALGGANANSAVAWPVKNDAGVIVGISDTDQDNPLGEAFSCWPFFASGAPTGKICNGFRWRDGALTPLPAFPGGYDSYATAANNRGEIVGWAENGVHDSTCVPTSQVLQFRAVIWEPWGEMKELPPLPNTGDTTTAATAINDQGEVVGISGICDVAVGRFSARHAVLWEDGVPIDLGSLGGVAWNTPTAINNQGTVVGFSDLPGDSDGTANYQAFLWTRSTGMQKLPLLTGETRSGAFGINDRGQVVGLSRTPNSAYHATMWHDGTVTDLNTVTQASAPYLIYANDINDRGEFAGEALDTNTGEAPAFVAVPAGRWDELPWAKSNGAVEPRKLPNKVRLQLYQKYGLDLGAN